MKHFQSHRKIYSVGFTIVETLVAISIILVAVVATLGAAQLGLHSSLFSRDQITAYYLADEVIEEIRNTRDSNNLNGVYWLTGINGTSPSCIDTGAGIGLCTMDVASNPQSPYINSCDLNASCSILKFDPNVGYNYVSGTPSIFSRTFYLTTINDHEMRITVQVKWRTGSMAPQTITLNDYIFNI